MLKLKRLKVHKCRTVQPGTELVFSEGINIILGKNGAGKTTLLKLIAAAVGSSFMDEFHADDLHVEYEYTLHDISIHCTIVHDEIAEAITGQAIRNRKQIFQATFQIPDGPLISARIQGDELTIVLRPFARLESKYTHRLDEGLDWLRQTLENLVINFLSLDTHEEWCTTNAGYTGVAPEFRAAFGEHRFKDLPEILTLHSGTLPLLQRACQQLGLKDISWTLPFIEHTRRTFEVKRYGHS